MTIEKAFTLKPSLQFKNAAILHITGKMHIAMHTLYQCGCGGCAKVELAADNNRFNKVNKAFDKAIEHIHSNGGFEAKDLLQKPIKNLTKETFSTLKNAVDTGITYEVPATMKTALEKNVFFFSSLKTYVSMKEASALLVDEKGNIKPLYQFKQDVLAINSKYNQNYLEAEHGFAVRSAQMAAKWVQFQKDGDRYDLQYRTANDGKVRPAHRALYNITLPISDPFWLSYWPPLGWRCRCNIVQVLKGKYEVTDSATASKLGEEATTVIGANGENKAEIFRGNSGAQERIFPENHPYAKLTPKAAVAIINQQADENSGGSFRIEKTVESNADLNDVLSKHANANKDFYERGFKVLKVETNKNNNGSTDMRGTIMLRSERIELVKNAMNNIKDGIPTTLSHEDALSTLWHEITHNRNKPGNMRLTRSETAYMELANEFVSRNTLPEFMKSLGGSLQHQQLITNRNSTGYNRMVRNYDRLIAFVEADKDKVIEDVQKFLFEEKYNKQLTGLIQAIKNNTRYKVGRVKELVGFATKLDEDTYAAFLERNKNLLIEK